MSSRNSYLTPALRREAPALFAALQQGRNLLSSDRHAPPERVRQVVRSALASHPDFQIEYIDVVDPVTLRELSPGHRPALLAAAVRLGSTRLIDNILVR